MNEDELTELAAKVSKSLRWAGFLLAAMLLILVVDLQLKRSIARTSIVAAGRHDAIVKMADGLLADLTRSGGRRERATVAADHGPSADGGDAGSDGMAGDAPLAAGTDQAGPAAKDVPAAAPGGPRKRATGNGRRTSRAAEGS